MGTFSEEQVMNKASPNFSLLLKKTISIAVMKAVLKVKKETRLKV